MTVPDWVIHQGDAESVLAGLPASSVHCVVTSPPYFGLRSYLPDGHPDKALEIGQEPTIGEYVARLVEVFRAVRRVLRPDGVLWLNLGDAYASDRSWGGRTSGKHVREMHGDTGIGRRRTATGLPHKSLMGLPWRVALALQEDDWVLRSDCIWHKPTAMPESVQDRPTRDHEYVFLLTPQSRYYYDAYAVRETAAESTRDRAHLGECPLSARQEAMHEAGIHEKSARLRDYGRQWRNLRTLWSVAAGHFDDDHFATFPPALVERCIRAATSERGCCPTCGAPWRRELAPCGQHQVKHAADKSKKVLATAGRLGATSAHVTGLATVYETVGWRPGCACPPAEPVPCVVLDPFAGAGTTGLVALRLGRRFVGVELSAKYVEMAWRRIVADAPLWNGHGALVMSGEEGHDVD